MNNWKERRDKNRKKREEMSINRDKNRKKREEMSENKLEKIGECIIWTRMTTDGSTIMPNNKINYDISSYLI